MQTNRDQNLKNVGPVRNKFSTDGCEDVIKYIEEAVPLQNVNQKSFLFFVALTDLDHSPAGMRVVNHT
jgi:hypothetical protein